MSSLIKGVKRQFLHFISQPLLKRLGYYKIKDSLDFPKSFYYLEQTNIQSIIDLHFSYLKNSGWIESKQRNIPYANERFIPWTSFPFIYYIDSIDLSNFRFLEFGSGSSTLYFTNKVKYLISIEFDDLYIKKIIELTRSFDNVKIINGNISNWGIKETYFRDIDVNQNEIMKAIANDRNYGFSSSILSCELIELIRNIHNVIDNSDIIFIDGHYRNLIMYLISKYHLGKTVIVDNSDFESLKFGVEQLKRSGYKEIPFYGLSPLNSYGTATSLFYYGNLEL
jgi:hypothetical protein